MKAFMHLPSLTLQVPYPPQTSQFQAEPFWNLAHHSRKYVRFKGEHMCSTEFTHFWLTVQKPKLRKK